VQNPARLVGAHLMLGLSLNSLGEFALAREQMERSLALYDPAQHRSLAFFYGEDLGVSCLSWLAIVLRILGYTDQALEKSRQALALARELSHPSSLAFALDWAASLYASLWKVRLAGELAEEAIVLSKEQGFPHWLAYGTIVRGWTSTMQGQGAEGIAQIRQGLSAYWALGAETGRPYFLGLLAEACGKVGQAEEGLTVLAEALAAVEKTGERGLAPELYRLKGELSLPSAVHGPQSEITSPQHPTPSTHAEAAAEACFQKAIEIARRQGAKSMELRAVMGLSGLWQHQGKKEEARQMLAETYGWFTEGFDTKDLQEAKARLAELGSVRFRPKSSLSRDL
jgi:predicted ATPase